MKRRGAGAQGRIAVGLALVVGCAGPAGSADRVEIRDAFVFEAAAGGTAAAYAVIVNGTDSAEVLDSITSTAAQSTTAHATKEVNGLVSMIPLERPTIAAHDSLVFQPGASHLMLEGVGAELTSGAKVPLVFWFHRAGRMAVEASVRPYGS